jgi:hypothetical protein
MNHKEHRERKEFKARFPSLRSLRSLRLKNRFKIKNQQNSRRLVSRLDRHERAIPGRARPPGAPTSPSSAGGYLAQDRSSDQLRESRANHPLNTHEEAIAQMRGFREAMNESFGSHLP